MVKKSLTLTLAVLVLNVFFGTVAFAQTQDNKDAQRERDVQIFVNRLGTGEKSRVIVKLKNDKKSVAGYISEIKDDSFVVTNKKRNTNTTLQYSLVKKVIKENNGLLIGGLIFAGIIITAAFVCGSGHCGPD